MRSRRSWLTLLAIAWLLAGAIALPAAEQIDQLSPESARALSQVKKPRTVANPGAEARTPVPSTPTPMAYTPAIRADGRHVVAIDIGHTVEQFGATSARGEGEFYFNQRIARLLFARLEKSTVVAPYLINPDGGRIGLVDRAKLAASKGAELFIAIHHDAANDRYLESWQPPETPGKTQKFSDRFSGYGVFVSKKNRQWNRSFEFASLLGDAMKAQGFPFASHHAEAIKGEGRPILDEARGIYQYDDLIVLKNAPMPALLLECGVIINRRDELELKKPDVQAKIVNALTSAIEGGFKRSQ